MGRENSGNYNSLLLIGWLLYIVTSACQTMAVATPTAIIAGGMIPIVPVISATITRTANGARDALPKQAIMDTMTKGTAL